MILLPWGGGRKLIIFICMDIKIEHKSIILYFKINFILLMFSLWVKKNVSWYYFLSTNRTTLPYQNKVHRNITTKHEEEGRRVSNLKFPLNNWFPKPRKLQNRILNPDNVEFRDQYVSMPKSRIPSKQKIQSRNSYLSCY